MNWCFHFLSCIYPCKLLFFQSKIQKWCSIHTQCWGWLDLISLSWEPEASYPIYSPHKEAGWIQEVILLWPREWNNMGQSQLGPALNLIWPNERLPWIRYDSGHHWHHSVLSSTLALHSPFPPSFSLSFVSSVHLSISTECLDSCVDSHHDNCIWT